MIEDFLLRRTKDRLPARRWKRSETALKPMFEDHSDSRWSSWGTTGATTLGRKLKYIVVLLFGGKWALKACRYPWRHEMREVRGSLRKPVVPVL